MDMISDFSGFIPRHDKYVGRFFMTNGGHKFHSRVDCSNMATSDSAVEVTIVQDADGNYLRAGSLADDTQVRGGVVSPCPRCNPLEDDLSVLPLSRTDTPCAGRDAEWVFHIRPDTSPDKIYPAQRECILDCPVLEECFHNFLKELPVYGVMGGVTYRQYREYGPKVLDIMRSRILNESESNLARYAATHAESREE